LASGPGESRRCCTRRIRPRSGPPVDPDPEAAPISRGEL
jgi:hypothetical protein